MDLGYVNRKLNKSMSRPMTHASAVLFLKNRSLMAATCSEGSAGAMVSLGAKMMHPCETQSQASCFAAVFGEKPILHFLVGSVRGVRLLL